LGLTGIAVGSGREAYTLLERALERRQIAIADGEGDGTYRLATQAEERRRFLHSDRTVPLGKRASRSFVKKL
jgi:hypothetical protein